MSARRGLSLVEILVSLSIFAVGVTAVIGLMTVATTTHKRAVNRVSAAWMAESLFDEMAARLTPAFNIADLPPGEGPSYAVATGVEREGFEGYFADVFLTPIEHPDDAALGLPPGEFLCEIRIHWRIRGQANSELFRTILVRRLDVGTGTLAGPPP